MAASAAKWREEQILIVCPGSRTTMAQLGCSELTPPTHRLPTRMFREGAQWQPYHTFQRAKVVDGVEEQEWVEDVDSDEGAVYPIKGGRIVQMDAFLAFLDHVHGMLTTTYHNTPIMLMASSQWTWPDCETIAQYVFEKTRTPALCMLHSGIASQYGLKWPSMTVVDIGFEKVDVTAIHDGRIVNQMNLGSPSPDRQISGGEVFTQELLRLLRKRGFNREMAEQLKRSAICEVLPYAAGAKELMELPHESTTSAATSGATSTAASSLDAPRASDPSRPFENVGEAGEAADTNGDDNGVLDVAAIVSSGQTKEFLAKKEKERERLKPGRKAKDKEADAGATKHTRLPNSKRTYNTFIYEEMVQVEVLVEMKPSTPPSAGAESPATAVVEAAEKTAEELQQEQEQPPPPPQQPLPSGDAPAHPNNGTPAAPVAPVTNVADTTATAPNSTSNGAAATPTNAAARDPPPPPPPAPQATELQPRRLRQDMHVGLERFTFASRNEIDRIVETIYRTIQGIQDMYMRPACWENLVFVGNGSRLCGLRDNIMQTLSARHLVSPSTATIFTSELPSNVATPSGTGAQTPTGSFTGAPPHQLPAAGGGGVNPLLQAATTASSLAAAGAAVTSAAGSGAGGVAAATHHFYSQTPTSIRTIALPTHLSEWTKNGFEEAMFLGAQVAARVAFCLHSNMDSQSIEAQRLMSLSRVDYNELGPKAIRTHSMLA